MPQRDQRPPGNGRGRPGKSDPMSPSPTKNAASISEAAGPTGCPHGCGPDGHEPDCGINTTGSNPGTCRCQRAYWTGRGVFICVCRQGVA